MMVVITIIAILTAIIVPMYLAEKRKAREKAVAQVAASFASAATAFVADNGVVPGLPGSADWPDPEAGPVDPEGVPYRRGAARGDVGPGKTATINSAGGSAGRVDYLPQGNDSFLMVAKAGSWSCYISHGTVVPPQGVEKCR